ncbi:MAG: hypothetical protein KDA61_05980 [Planctomycetales bacterium]|nr:hypothetical protein [Planctomycetales bacterium]
MRSVARYRLRSLMAGVTLACLVVPAVIGCARHVDGIAMEGFALAIRWSDDRLVTAAAAPSSGNDAPFDPYSPEFGTLLIHDHYAVYYVPLAAIILPAIATGLIGYTLGKKSGRASHPHRGATAEPP